MRSLLFTLLVFATMPAYPEVVHIAVAANFKPTAEKLNALFEARFNHTTTLSSASTGTLYSQILHGAPFDIFFAADQSSAAALAEKGLGDRQFCYARGVLVLLGSQNPGNSLANPSLSLAIANPATAPYGRAAIQVLQRPEFRRAGQRKLVRANNATQAYQHWRNAAVDLAIVPMSLAGGEGAAIPADWYTPIDQYVTGLRRGSNKPAAQAYITWLESEEVRALINNAGYESCP